MKDDIPKINEPIGRTADKPFGIQRDPYSYYGSDYLSPERLSSYGYQFRLAIETNSRSFLNVGSANFILKQLLEKQKRSVLDLDLDFLTKPDIIGALPFLPFPDKSLDVVMCFQMLEHLPFILLGSCIKEIKRIAKEYILLSLPDRTRSKSQIAKYFIYRILKHPSYWRMYQLLPTSKEHFWEIGHSNITEDTLLCVIRNEGVEVVKHFRNPYNAYHHFFILAATS
jgi:hypothetical protein